MAGMQTCGDARLWPLQLALSAYLHAADAHAQAGGSALCALLHVTGLLLLGCIIPVLPSPHLQIQDAGLLVL